MDSLVHPREQLLGRVTLVLGVLVWALLVLGTLGIALVYVVALFVGYLFAQSAFVSYIRGNGVKLSPEQLPDLYHRFETCCERLGIKDKPQAYVLHGDGMLNAFATRFLGRDFVVLLTETVDAMDQHPDGVNFYIGHELGHIARKHLTGWKWRAPVLWVPLLGAAYSRSREYTCDRHGAACCSSPENAARSLSALAAGTQRWRDLGLKPFAAQAAASKGFWMSFNELIGSYPWLCKRVLAVMRPEVQMPRRHPLAWLLGLFVPNTGAGAAGVLIVVAIIGMLAAVAVPAYTDYTKRAGVALHWQQTGALREALARHYLQEKAAPASLAEAGLPERLADGSSLSLDTRRMVVTVAGAQGELLLVPSKSDTGAIEWHCQAGEGLTPSMLPANCREKP